MLLKESFTYPDTDVEAVYSLISNPDFREEAAADGGGSEIEVTVKPEGEGHTITVVRTQETDMPDFVKKFAGDTVKVKQTEKWGGPDGDGNRAADVKFSVIGQPVEMLGTATMAGSGDVEFAVEGDVKVNVPFIGRKFEPEIAKAITASLRNDVELGKTRR